MMIRKKTMKHLSQPNNARPIIQKHLNADALFQGVYNDFSKISDFRLNNIKISIEDALMSGFAMFSLKDPSLLAFDERRGVDLNLNTIYGIWCSPLSRPKYKKNKVENIICFSRSRACGYVENLERSGKFSTYLQADVLSGEIDLRRSPIIQALVIAVVIIEIEVVSQPCCEFNPAFILIQINIFVFDTPP